MGCFSFMCKNSGKAALSSSFDGSPCYMFLLKDGKVLEEMYGNYNSYGAVFTKELRTDVSHKLYQSFKWKMDWNDVCNLMFSPNTGNGIALILEEHYTGVHPTTRSEQDPNQGWGSDEDEDEEEDETDRDSQHVNLFSSTACDIFKQVEQPYHKVYYDTPIDLSDVE